MKISYSNNLGKTPARVNRATGEIFLNSEIWPTLPKPYQDFVLQHEIGHYKWQTTNELLADTYAFIQLAGKYKGSLKNAVNTICDILNGSSEIQQIRRMNIYRLALTWDKLNDPQSTTDQELSKIENNMLSYFDNGELLEYKDMLSQKGTTHDYMFPGYSSNMFDYSVGSTFQDVPINTGTIQTEFQQKYGSGQSITDYQTAMPVTTQTSSNETNQNRMICLDEIPLFPSRITIDFKTLLIIILGIIVIVAISKSKK